MSTLYMGASEETVAKYVLFSGDPWRVEVVKKYLDNPKKVAFMREFNTYTGTYKGVEITVTSTGIGAPSAAIAMEEMYESGMQVAVRMGTVMSMQDDMLGHFMIPIAAMRREGTSQSYVDLSYPAVADVELVNVMNETVQQMGKRYLNGLNCTMDGFYSCMHDSKFSLECGRDMSKTFEEVKKLGVTGIDMESSCILTLGRLMGVKTCILTVVTVLENLKETLKGQDRVDAEDLLCRTALEGIYNYHIKREDGKMSKEILTLNSQTVIGMVHCLPLPTTAGFDGDYQRIIDRAVQDAVTLEKAGVDAVIVENMGDTPFSAFLNKAQVAALTAAAYAVKQAVQIPVGLDAAFNDCEADIAIAAMVGASFIRVPVFVDTVLFTDGIIQPCAKKCMEYRKMMGQENVKILADVQVKHAHMLREHITIEQSAKDAASNGADGIIVTGTQVGEETPLDLIKRVKNVVNLPVFAGSGVNAENIHDQLQTADGAIIGSSLKEGGILTNPISYELVKKVLDGLK